MSERKKRRALAALLVTAALVAGCGGDDDEPTSQSGTPDTAETTASTEALEPLDILVTNDDGYASAGIDAVAEAPTSFQVHTLVGMLLFAIWPFTRLVHAFTAPFHYLFRPYIVYRSRDPVNSRGARSPRAGWDPVGTPDRGRTKR